MPRLRGVTQTRPPASPAVLQSLGHCQLRNPSWELPLHEHEVRAQCPSGLLSSQWTLIQSLSSREDGSKSPGPEVHEAHPGPLANTCPHATLPAHCPQHPQLPAQALPLPGPRRVWWERPQELCSPCPRVLSWLLMEAGPWTPHVSPEGLRSSSPDRSK